MAVTVTYEYPVAGVVAPTALQARVAACNATVVATADADTTATIQHNMGLSVAQLAQGFPNVEMTILLQVVAKKADWTISSRTADTVVLTKTAAVGSGSASAQLRVSVARPHSITK